MTLKNFERNIIVNIDNYKNEHLNDPIFIKYVIEFSEKGGATSFLTSSYDNLKLLKEHSKLPIFFQIDTKTDQLPDVDVDFIIIDMGDYEEVDDALQSFVKEVKDKFDCDIIGRIANKKQAILACKLGFRGIIAEISGESLDKDFVYELNFDINIPTILSLNAVNLNDCKEFTTIGIKSFIIGEDVINPSKILSRV